MILNGYQIIETLFEDEKKTVYRGIRKADNLQLIIKLLKSAYPALDDIYSLKYEYEILSALDIDGVSKAYSFDKLDDRYVLFLDDCGGYSLDKYLNSNKLSIKEFLSLAIRITAILGAIHKANVIHKNINPANIIFNHDNNDVQIVDFSSSILLNRENPEIQSIRYPPDRLLYMSPEETGKINRTLDYRTDFYSLGLTFYKMLTGVVPFQYLEKMELIYSHLAVTPPPPHELNPDIPITISDIVMKLTAKNSEDRYQSSSGINHDLEKCLEQLNDHMTIDNFKIAENDLHEIFIISEKLYGREKELEILEQSLEEAGDGKTKLLLVAGYSGVGKSTLIHEVNKPLLRKKGSLITGKFDQYKKDIPYASFIQAFTILIKNIITRDSPELIYWREEILKSLGSNGQIIIDVIPEIKIIIGEQNPVQVLQPLETANRFNHVFQNFLKVFAKKEHPLIIFLDDLQWADSASLNLIETVISDTETKNILFIAAYRDNEVDQTHPLIMMLNKLNSADNQIKTINLLPLSLNSITEMISDTLKCDKDRVIDLAELCQKKTGGNPFFLIQFLKKLYYDKLFFFNYTDGTWQWMLDLIQSHNSTDNIIDMMISKIRLLPVETQKILQFASCIGIQFDLKTLELISIKSGINAKMNLSRALLDELILPLDDQYKFLEKFELENISFRFLHDRVQQAAYSLISEKEKNEIHLIIGYMLLDSCVSEKIDNHIFEIVNHLNTGMRLITSPDEHFSLLRLNLTAGKKAMRSNAYQSALNYFTAGFENITDDPWLRTDKTIFELFLKRSECEYLTGNFDKSEELIFELLKNTESVLEKAEGYNLLAVQYTVGGRYSDALKIVTTALKLLDVELPQSEFEQYISIEREQLAQKIKDKTISSLIDEPLMTDPEKIMAVRLLINTIVPVYNISPQMFPIICLKMVNLHLMYGNLPDSYGYASYSIVLPGLFKEYREAYEYSLLAFNISKKYNDLPGKCKAANILADYANFNVHHIRFSESINIEGFQAGLESGEFMHGGYCAMHIPLYSFYQGKNLSEVIEESNTYHKFCRKVKHFMGIDLISGIQLAMNNLSKKTYDKESFTNDEFDNEQLFLNTCISHQSNYPLGIYLVIKAQILYLYEMFDEAYKVISEAKDLSPYYQGIISIPECIFYHSLILCKRYPHANKDECEKILTEINENQKIMKEHSDYCPENFLSFYLLIQAETERIRCGDFRTIMSLYNKAIESAHNNDFVQNEALANEAASKFYIENGFKDFAVLHMTKAYYLYKKWGAARKAEELENKYSDYISNIFNSSGNFYLRRKTESLDYLSHGHNISDIIDLESLVKASQIIFSEFDLEKLLNKIMTLVMKNSGAQKGAFVSKKGDSWSVDAYFDNENKSVIVYNPEDKKSDYNNDKIEIPEGVVNYVARTREKIIVEDPFRNSIFENDNYIVRVRPRSILSIPLLDRDNIAGILYLENNTIKGAFTEGRIDTLELLSSQIALSIVNARNLQFAKIAEDERTAKIVAEQRNLEMRGLNLRLENQAQELQLKNTLLQNEVKERKIAEETIKSLLSEKELILKEVQHRIKNFIISIKGLVYLQADSLKDPSAISALQDTENRINSMMILYDKLYLTENYNEMSVSDYIPSLVDEIIFNFPNFGSVNVVKNIDDFVLNSKKLQPLGIIINELLTNCMKSAFTGRDNGVITVSAVLTDYHTAVVVISDNGVGMPESVNFENSTGFGMQLVRMLSEQIDGNIRIERGNGTKFLLEFKV